MAQTSAVLFTMKLLDKLYKNLVKPKSSACKSLSPTKERCNVMILVIILQHYHSNILDVINVEDHALQSLESATFRNSVGKLAKLSRKVAADTHTVMNSELVFSRIGVD